jgi:hypothetical protein
VFISTTRLTVVLCRRRDSLSRTNNLTLYYTPSIACYNDPGSAVVNETGINGGRQSCQ